MSSNHDNTPIITITCITYLNSNRMQRRKNETYLNLKKKHIKRRREIRKIQGL